MKLKRFRVTNFRSVSDSGWIDADNVTSLIGVNESGKTNLLLPLWKLKPARDGEIQETSDYPKTMFGEIRKSPGDFCFVEAEFATGAKAGAIAEKSGIDPAAASTVVVRKYFDDTFEVRFPEHAQQTTTSSSEVVERLEQCEQFLSEAKALKQEEELFRALRETLSRHKSKVQGETNAGPGLLSAFAKELESCLPEEPAKTSVLVPTIQQLVSELRATVKRLTRPDPGDVEGVADFVFDLLPSFVYYSNYGNLDSEIYLPHVVENMKRGDLGAKEAAKVRTLKVLFKFVDLEAEEILELGRDFKDPNGQERKPTNEEIEVIAEKKRTRSILLQSAGATLTEKFRDWWKQGDYRFRFEADGYHFRIWVADDRRPTEVELENRSTGLQWFLSFYLVFLVESRGDLKRSILLLDEPGMSLHPLAQRNLSRFFDSLAETNQILYTSHSPFLVDADRLERARKVYVASDGTTKATANLRHNEGRDAQEGAAYAVHSALNLSVAESLLVGCQPVLVEGASDQHYLTLMKSILVALGRIKPKRELVFPPTGGTKTAKVTASILTGRDDELPYILLDSDKPGENLAKSMRADLYKPAPERILSVRSYSDFENAEIEDLFPAALLADEMDRIEREADQRLADVVRAGEPFVPQVEAWAQAEQISLEPGWKVRLAVRIKQRGLAKGGELFPDSYLETWTRIFTDLGVAT